MEATISQTRLPGGSTRTRQCEVAVRRSVLNLDPIRKRLNLNKAANGEDKNASILSRQHAEIRQVLNQDEVRLASDYSRVSNLLLSLKVGLDETVNLFNPVWSGEKSNSL